MPYIAALDIDPEGGNREEMHRHRVSADEVVEVLEDRPIITPNPAYDPTGFRHAATHLMTGLTQDKRLLTVAIAPHPYAEDVWRPVTAFDTNQDLTTKYYKKHSR